MSLARNNKGKVYGVKSPDESIVALVSKPEPGKRLRWLYSNRIPLAQMHMARLIVHVDFDFKIKSIVKDVYGEYGIGDCVKDLFLESDLNEYIMEVAMR